MTYHPGKPRQGPAYCVPEKRFVDCLTCTRYRPQTPIKCSGVIDATTLRWPAGVCPMRVPT